VTFPTDAKLVNRSHEKLVRLAQLTGVSLRQSYARVGKFALIQHQRYAHAKQFKRANRLLKTLRTYLGRVIRDIGRKIEGNGGLEAAFAKLLLLARRVRGQQQRQRGAKVYSLHAPEVECIGKGKAHRPYEFGVKVSVATTLKHCKGGRFVTHVKALPGNPYDGHRLATVIPDTEALVGNTIARILADKGYRGHNAPPRRGDRGNVGIIRSPTRASILLDSHYQTSRRFIQSCFLVHATISTFGGCHVPSRMALSGQ
jgi:IS5 family transposase